MMADQRGKKWFILVDHTEYAFGAEYLYHGVIDKAREKWYFYEDHGETPMCIGRIGPFVPPVADVPGGGLVISGAARDALWPLSRAALLPVQFTKAVAMDWQPGDDVPDHDLDEVEHVVTEGIHDAGMVAAMEPCFELIVSNYRLYLEAQTNVAQRAVRTFRVNTSSSADEPQYVEWPWIASYFGEVDVAAIPGAGHVVSSSFLEKLGPLLDLRWFRVVPWGPQDWTIDRPRIRQRLLSAH